MYSVLEQSASWFYYAPSRLYVLWVTTTGRIWLGLGLQLILWLEPWFWLAIVINYTRLKWQGKQTWKKHLYAQNKSSLTLTKVEER